MIAPTKRRGRPREEPWKTAPNLTSPICDVPRAKRGCETVCDAGFRFTVNGRASAFAKSARSRTTGEADCQIRRNSWTSWARPLGAPSGTAWVRPVREEPRVDYLDRPIRDNLATLLGATEAKLERCDEFSAGHWRWLSVIADGYCN